MKTKIILASLLLMSGSIFANIIKDPTIREKVNTKNVTVTEKNYDYLKFNVDNFYQPDYEYIKSNNYDYLKFDVNKYYSANDSINELPK